MAGEWDISTDSTSLLLIDTQMKTRFAPSAQFFCKITFSYTIFEVNGQMLSFFLAHNIAFMVLKTIGTISRSQRKNLFVKGPNIGWWFGLAHKVKKHFCIYLGAGCIIFQTNFCVETGRSCRLFWVPWELHSERKNDKKIGHLP